MIAGKGTGAVAVGVAQPARSHAITDREVSDFGSDSSDPTLDLVATDERIGGDAPVVLPHVVVAVTDAAMRDQDLHLVRSDRSELVFKRGKSRSGSQGGPGVNGGRI